MRAESRVFDYENATHGTPCVVLFILLSAVTAAATAAVIVAEIVKNGEYRDDDGKICSVEKIAKAIHIRSSFLLYAF